METRLSGINKDVIISDTEPTVLIGERINATGKKKLSAALKAEDMELVRKEALAQVAAGADILDVNVGVADIDEVVVLPKIVQIIQDTVDVPLCIDSGNPKALEAALRVCQGKPILNSTTGEEYSMDAVLPLVREYGSAVVGLVMDGHGISDDLDRRVAIASRIVERAELLGIPRQDIIIDCLLQTVGANHKSVLVTIETMARIKAELGVNVTLGASNASFGLPDRGLLNNAFIAMAIAAGLNCAIADVAQVSHAVLAADLLIGRDKYARRYIAAYQQRQK